MDIYTVTPQMLDKQGICSNGIFSDSKPRPLLPSGILGSTCAWFWWCCCNQNTSLEHSTHSSFPHWVSGSLKHSLPPLSLSTLYSAYFCDLHVAEIFVELNYFYTSLFMWPAFWGLFPLAGGWERSAHWGVLRASGTGVPCSGLDAHPLLAQGIFSQGRVEGCSPTLPPPPRPPPIPKCLGGDECDSLIMTVQ